MSTLLRYDLLSTPFPLQASPTNGPANSATVSVMCTNGSMMNAVQLLGISVQFTVGSLASQLTSNPSAIGPVAPAGWTLSDTKTPTGFIVFVFLPVKSPATLAPGASLQFTFNGLQPNTAPGETLVTITEGTNGNPTTDLSLTKWPDQWGTVSFWVNPVEVAPGGSVTLNWNGTSSGATYTIQYFDPVQGQEVSLPAVGQPAFGNTGVYPGQGQPALTLQQTTVFTMMVEETIGPQTYISQIQQTVTVAIPAPVINSFTVTPSTPDPANPPVSLTLSWSASNVSSFTINGVGTFTGAQAASGSTTVVSPNVNTLYTASCEGLPGFSGTTPTASCWLYYVGVASFDSQQTWGTDGTLLFTVALGAGRNVFNAVLAVNGNGTPGQEQDFALNLELVSGVQVADLGTAGLGAGYAGVASGTYGTTVPNAQIWDGYEFNFSDDVFGEEADNVGATWGVRFPDGKLALLWYSNAWQDGTYYGTHQWGFKFQWTFFN